MIDSRIAESFNLQSMMTTLGAKLVLAAEGQAEIRAPILETSRQHHGFAHAALTFALGDTAAGYAAQTVMPEGKVVLTSEMKIHLLAPGQGDYLYARGWVVKPGRRLIVVQSEVYAVVQNKEQKIALLTGTMIPTDIPLPKNKS